jgi:hypothetical protein
MQAWLQEHGWKRRNGIVAFYHAATRQRRRAALAPQRAAKAALSSLTAAEASVTTAIARITAAGASAEAAGAELDTAAARAQLDAVIARLAAATAAAEALRAQLERAASMSAPTHDHQVRRPCILWIAAPSYLFSEIFLQTHGTPAAAAAARAGTMMMEDEAPARAELAASAPATSAPGAWHLLVEWRLVDSVGVQVAARNGSVNVQGSKKQSNLASACSCS